MLIPARLSLGLHTVKRIKLNYLVLTSTTKRQNVQFVNSACDWLTLPTPHATAGFRAIDLERFWINTVFFGTIKKRETFVPETIENTCN